MNSGKHRRRTTLSWLFVAGLFALCGVLGVLQYRWIGEVSTALRERLRGSLQANLNRLSLDFSTELAAACRALLPEGPGLDSQVDEAEVAERYAQWKKTGRHIGMFRHIAIAEPRNQTLVLRNLDLDRAVFQTVEWPSEWVPVKTHLENMIPSQAHQRRNFPALPPDDQGTVFDVPAFGAFAPGRPNGEFAPGESPSLVFDVNPQYIRDVLLPELLQHHLETGGTLEYQVEVLNRQRPSLVIYQSDPGAQVAASADASVGLFEIPYDQILRRLSVRGGRGRGSGRGSPGGDSGRWRMFVRHRAGSLEAVVEQARWRNVAVTAGVLLLMMASVAALITYTRRAQRLADLQMDFVAGISHELSTPLTVIHTAAYNLRGKLAANPAQVERYGVLIQQESGRLKELVQQVLRFSSATAGRAIQSPEPLSVPDVLEETLESAHAVIQQAGCVVEKNIDPNLPVVMGDPMALKQALQNLLHNAAKYGAGESRWIGVSASRTGSESDPVVEIRVADRGPGIPADEQAHIFEPFFRGRSALRDQIHGTGLGLNLAKKIVEAHGGSIQVKSVVMRGSEFIVRLPAMPDGESA
jgi:signal transduction histidine kinase